MFYVKEILKIIWNVSSKILTGALFVFVLSFCKYIYSHQEDYVLGNLMIIPIGMFSAIFLYHIGNGMSTTNKKVEK